MSLLPSMLAVSLLAAGASGGAPEAWLLREYAARFEARAADLRRTGRLDEARILLERALGIRENLEGRESPRVARLQKRLGDLSLGQGREAEARRRYLRALAIRRRAGGASPAEQYPGVESPFRQPPTDSLEVARARADRAEALRLERRDLQAEGHLRRAWKGIVEATGPLRSRDLLGGTAARAHRVGTRLYQEGRLAEAAPLFRRALRLWEQELGEDHPQALECRWRLAKIRRRLGRRHYVDEIPPGLANLALEPHDL